jgi:predicted amidophosphoribosyltransferase
VLDLLLPRRCLVCGTAGTLLCSNCCALLPPLTPPLCAFCGAPTAWPVSRCRECTGRRLAFTRARAAVAYDADVRKVVRGWKERGLRSLSVAAATVIAERLPRPDADVIAFVPPDRRRRLERGYHPAEQLARALADAWTLPCESLLTRTGRSRPQRGLALAERRRNVAHAFAASSAHGIVLLVDDVYTSGSTADAATRALRAAGAAGAEVVTFARAVRGPSAGVS